MFKKIDFIIIFSAALIPLVYSTLNNWLYQWGNKHQSITNRKITEMLNRKNKYNLSYECRKLMINYWKLGKLLI